jgi:hypothetical protein
MPAHLDPSPAAASNLHQENDALRLLSRSPHPYHKHKSDLLEPSDRFPTTARSSALRASLDGNHPISRTSFPAVSRESSPTSDSGTEADDEHFLKGLPAPKTKLHKGLRGRNEILSGTSSPLPSPALHEEEGRRNTYIPLIQKKDSLTKEFGAGVDHSKRNRVIVRRLAELLLLGSLGAVVQANPEVRPVLYQWRIGGFVLYCLLVSCL